MGAHQSANIEQRSKRDPTLEDAWQVLVDAWQAPNSPSASRPSGGALVTVEAEDEIPSAPRRRQKSEQETVSERREYLASAHPPSQTVGIFCPEVATPRTKNPRQVDWSREQKTIIPRLRLEVLQDIQSTHVTQQKRRSTKQIGALRDAHFCQREIKEHAQCGSLDGSGEAEMLDSGIFRGSVHLQRQQEDEEESRSKSEPPVGQHAAPQQVRRSCRERAQEPNEHDFPAQREHHADLPMPSCSPRSRRSPVQIPEYLRRAVERIQQAEEKRLAQRCAHARSPRMSAQEESLSRQLGTNKRAVIRVRTEPDPPTPHLLNPSIPPSSPKCPPVHIYAHNARHPSLPPPNPTYRLTKSLSPAPLFPLRVSLRDKSVGAQPSESLPANPLREETHTRTRTYTHLNLATPLHLSTPIIPSTDHPVNPLHPCLPLTPPGDKCTRTRSGEEKVGKRDETRKPAEILNCSQAIGACQTTRSDCLQESRLGHGDNNPKLEASTRPMTATEPGSPTCIQESNPHVDTSTDSSTVQDTASRPRTAKRANDMQPRSMEPPVTTISHVRRGLLDHDLSPLLDHDLSPGRARS